MFKSEQNTGPRDNGTRKNTGSRDTKLTKNTGKLDTEFKKFDKKFVFKLFLLFVKKEHNNDDLRKRREIV